MSLPPATPRDHLQRMINYGRKTSRYWWLVAVLVVLGGGLSLAFALTRPRSFQTWTTLFYEEPVQPQILFPGRAEVTQRNLGDRYRERLLARHQLEQIIGDPALDPYPGERDPDVKLDRLRLAVRLESHGSNVLRLAFTDSDPERARRVADKLAAMLQDTDEALRKRQASATVAFMTKQLSDARAELAKHGTAYTRFVAEHPEFVLDAGSTQVLHGVSRPASQTDRLQTLLHRRRQILDSLAAPPGSPPPAARPTPERIAAENAVAKARHELDIATRDLDQLLTRVTEIHPAAVGAQQRVTAAARQLRDAQAALPPDIAPEVRAATPEDRIELQRKLEQVEAQIRIEQARTGAPSTAATDRVVQLEGEYSELHRALVEQGQQVQLLADIAFRVQIDANEKLAEQGSRLEVVDPAFKPERPSGLGRTIVVSAGLVLSLTLGLLLALGLAVIDDRLYRRADLDHLGLGMLVVIPPAAHPRRKA